MNRRQRFLGTMTFGSPDRPATGDYFYYASTLRRWEREGLPPGVELNHFFEMDFDPFQWKVEVSFEALPDHGTTLLEETSQYAVERISSGAVVRRLKNEPPPAMPQWLRYPLQSRQEWPAFRRRFDPDAPQRLPPNLGELAAASATRGYPLGMWVGSTYGYLRDWWGVEALSYLFHDEPSLVDEMIEVLTHLSLRLLDRVIAAGVQLDWVMFWEDMAYKNGPLISPELYRRHCLPFYVRMMERVRAAGVPVAMVDSDGDITQLIPLWLDAGVTIMHPMEVAAGMDVIQIRKRYGKRVGFFGGIDKRALAGTRPQIREEVVPKLEACLPDGGYIPACDHAIPPDVSFDNYCYFRDLVREVSERLFG